MTQSSGTRYSPTPSWWNMARPRSGPTTTMKAMQGRVSSDTAETAWEISFRTSAGRPRAQARDSRGTSTRFSAPRNTMGSDNIGIVIPHTTPNWATAAERSIPPSTSFCGIRAELAAPIRLPSRALSPTGRAMDRMRRRRTRPSSPLPARKPLRRR